MTKQSVVNQLDLVEQQFNEVFAVVADGNPELIEAATAGLQRLSVDFVQLLDAPGARAAAGGDMAVRIKALAEGLAVLRSQLLRRAAYVEQALKIVVPTTDPGSTYAGGSPYGTVQRQTGAFRVLAA
jgi:hypothetical protein